MQNFINTCPKYYSVVSAAENITVLGFGYDDFTVTKPLLDFHMQGFYTWHFVLSGSGTLEVEDKVFSVKCGDMFFLPSDVKMRYYPDKSDPWKYVWFSLNTETAEHYRTLLGFSRVIYVLKNCYGDITVGILKGLLTGLTEGTCGNFSILSVFYRLMDIYASHNSGGGIQSIKEAIDANCLSQFFSIEQLCRDIGISHTHLLRLFKKEYGQTIIGYITEKRIAYACELLVTTELSVKAVAFSCGFSDEMHFMKSFKKATGFTALQYRKGGFIV